MDIWQFLLSYWWIIFLIAIIVLLVTRSLIKLIISIIVFTVIFILFWQILIAPGFSKSTKCFTNEAERQALIYDRAQSMAPGEERNQFICNEDVASFKSLTQCFNVSRQDNNLSFSIYSRLPKFRRIISETITDHNELCPQSPLVNPNY